MFELLTSFA